MTRKKWYKVVGLSLLFALQTQNSAWAETLIEEGERFYAESNFEKAGRCFQTEIRDHPDFAQAHYLMGNVFVELNRRLDAVQEYRWAIRLDPHGLAGQYSERALNAIEKNGAGSGRTPGHSTAIQEPPQTSEMHAMQSSARRISAQTNETESQASAECEARVRDTTNDAERRIAGLKREMQEKIDANGQATYAIGGRRRSTMMMMYNPAADNQLIRNDYDHQIEAIMQDQNKRIAAIKASYKERQSAAEDTAITLDKEYVDHNHSGNVKLTPQGTDVHVRSYETSDEPSGNAVPIALPPAKTLGDSSNKKLPTGQTKKPLNSINSSPSN
jgi:tetratricopeptide (TPR) repeat protein